MPAADRPAPHVLCVLDGVGWGPRDAGDAVHLARTPTLDALLAAHPWCLLQAHGRAVGMPSDADMGNSEVGHNAMGAGRVFDQGAALVDDALRSGRAWEGPAWAEVIAAARGGALHLLGLVSDGNVHSHVRHLHALIDRAVADGVRRIRVHALTDGRDVAPHSALTWIAPLEDRLRALAADGVDARVATVAGRMRCTMDRYEADWDMVARGWALHVWGQGPVWPSAVEAIHASRSAHPELDDQWLPAAVIGAPEPIAAGDAVVLFNFRGDRAIEISRAFTEGAGFGAFSRRGPAGEPPPPVTFAGMMQYDGDLLCPPRYLVSPPVIDDTVALALGRAGRRSLAVSETQKFGHVTYFFNGNRSEVPAGEDQLKVPSLNVPFNEAPAMRAAEVTDAVVAALEAGRHDALRLNLANGDMVGHTGDLAAAIAAVEVLDACLARLVAACAAAGAVLLVTADHGNCEQMLQIDKTTGQPLRGPTGAPLASTSHTLNPVPFLLVDPTGRWALAAPTGPAVRGGIAQIGATVLTLAGVQPPDGWLPPLVRPRTENP